MFGRLLIISLLGAIPAILVLSAPGFMDDMEMTQESMAMGQIIGYSTFLVVAAAVLIAIRQASTRISRPTFGRLLGVGVLTGALAGVMLGIPITIVYNVINPEWYGQMFEAYVQMVETNPELSDAERAAALTQIEAQGQTAMIPGFEAMLHFVTLTFVGLVMGLIGAALWRQRGESAASDDASVLQQSS